MIKRVQHWSAVEDIDYYFFLTLKYKQLGQRKKSTRLYVEMSTFIQTKTPVQCRTHHEKRLNEWKKRQNSEMNLLHKFYREYYTIRNIDLSHLRYEIDRCLEEKRQQRIITQAQFQSYQNNLDQNLKEIGFQTQTKECEEKDAPSKDLQIIIRQSAKSSPELNMCFEEQADQEEIQEKKKRRFTLNYKKARTID